MNINKVTYAGRIGNIASKATPQGMSICEFSVATNKRRKDKQEVTTWMNCVAFGKTAETISQYFAKGDRIYLEGELNVRSWESKSGEKHTSTSITVSSFEFIDGKSSSHAAPQETHQQQPEAVAAGDDWDLDDDIGF